MSFRLLDSLKLLIKSNYFLFKAARYPLTLIGYYEKKARSKVDASWKERIDRIVSAPDNANIKRVESAGKIERDFQMMHNGLKVHVGSYYGDANTVLIAENAGVHEPEEEFAFAQVLTYISPGAIMVELGAFWGYYSMFFQQSVKDAKNYMIEPDRHALLSGINNFKLNGLKGEFHRYFISDVESNDQDPPTISIDAFVRQKSISQINILHSDIQSFELKMLHGAVRSLNKRIIDYIFISTHSNELHDDCKSFLQEHKYLILCDATLEESYSWDGLIVARRVEMQGPQSLEIHKRSNNGITEVHREDQQIHQNK
ncbi:MAG: FkbM family methyltransferase [Chryseolinea sp.]